MAIEKALGLKMFLKNKISALAKDLKQAVLHHNNLGDIFQTIELNQIHENGTMSLLVEVDIGLCELLDIINELILMYEDQLEQVNDLDMSKNSETAIMALIDEISYNQIIITKMEKKLRTKIEDHKEQLIVLSTRVEQIAKNAIINQSAEEAVPSGDDTKGLVPEALVSLK